MRYFIDKENQAEVISLHSKDVDFSKLKEVQGNTEEAATEKHIPVYEVKENVVYVKVGSVEHPMLDNHYIKWIVLVTDVGTYIKKLRPSQPPVAKFHIDDSEVVLEVLAYCNLHGLWKALE